MKKGFWCYIKSDIGIFIIIEKYKILSHNQVGFRENKGTSGAVLKV